MRRAQNDSPLWLLAGEPPRLQWEKQNQKRTRRPNKGWLAGSSATQTICSSFLLVIAVGTLLLTLPISSRTGRLGVIDAMFTATSATCVTGLVVRDTWSQFSLFGQVIILMLIQVGGLGLVTLTSFFALAARRRMGFRDLRLLGESVSADGLSKATEVLEDRHQAGGGFRGRGHRAAALRICAAVRRRGCVGQRVHGHLGFLQRRL